MRRVLALAAVLAVLTGCSGGGREPVDADPQVGPHAVVLHVDSPQQMSSYTSGPAAARAILRFYGRDYDEFDIAREMRIDDLSDTPPERLAKWLENHAFSVTWGENGTLAGLRRDLAAGHPILVEWNQVGAHWATVIGYDDRGTAENSDDIVVFSDPAAGKAGHADGRMVMKAQDFDAQWSDARSFGKPVTRVFITAVAAPAAR